jgi:hypothetical protein
MNLETEGRRVGGGHVAAWDAVIFVDPVERGWCVTGPLAERRVFLTGGRAEHQARKLGRRLAALGQTAIIEIHDRAGAMAGSVLYLAEEQVGAP